MPAPEGGFPHFEGYDVVSVRVREATITATNRGDANEAHGGAYVYEVPPVATTVEPQVYSHTPAAPSQPYVQSVMPQVQPVITPGMAVPMPRKQGVRGRDVAIWICVAQLGVIIWCLLGPMMHQQNAGVVLKTASSWQGEVGKAFNKAKANVMARVAYVAHPAPVKKPPKGGKKPYARSAGKGFVPPPPPELASNSRMMVPPPPVAYKLPMPGAAAASTLPAPPAGTAVKALREPVIAQQPEEVLTPNTVPSALPTRAVIVPAVSIADAEDKEPAAESTPLPVPDWLQKVPKYNWHDAMNEPTTPAPTPVRTVMNGNRTRIITDR